jgi:hypothetical protein
MPDTIADNMNYMPMWANYNVCQVFFRTKLSYYFIQVIINIRNNQTSHSSSLVHIPFKKFNCPAGRARSAEWIFVETDEK